MERAVPREQDIVDGKDLSLPWYKPRYEWLPKDAPHEDKVKTLTHVQFSLKTCAMAKKYIMHMTELEENQLEVHKTASYMVVALVGAKGLQTIKIPCHVIYCIDEEDFNPVWEAIEGK